MLSSRIQGSSLFTSTAGSPVRAAAGSSVEAEDNVTSRQRRICKAPGFTMLVGVPLMKLTTLSNAAPKYSS